MKNGCLAAVVLLIVVHDALAAGGEKAYPPAAAWTEGVQPLVPLRVNMTTSANQPVHAERALAAVGAVPQVATSWSGTTVNDLHQEYYNIFPSGNRNAASHLWSRFILERSSQMTASTLESLFEGFCPISGSPTAPMAQSRYKLTLDLADGSGTAEGLMYFCCWPCVCDTKDLLKVDTKRVITQDGERIYRFVVIGNPCIHPEQLLVEHEDPFGRSPYSLAQSAPDLKCEGDTLRKAVLSDHGHVIIGLFHDVPSSLSDGDLAATDAEMQPRCEARAQGGYSSGMGTIFRLAAGINPIVNGEVVRRLSVTEPVLQV